MKRYSEAKMREAFTKVQNKKNWKLPIHARIEGDVDRDLIQAAVIYFTGSVCEFTDLPSGEVLVDAAGYYACIGA